MQKKILITFGRSFLSLDLARQLKRSGHKIFMADSMSLPLSRFSNAIDKFYKVPRPKFSPEGFVSKLIEIVEKHQIDFLLPVYEETSLISQAMHRFPKHCKVFCPSFDLFHTLHNKGTFQELLQQLDIKTLQFKVLKSPADLLNLNFDKPYALKACYSRASQRVYKVQPGQHITGLNISAKEPWIAQEWAEGARFCTYSICHDGELMAHGTYPVDYTIDGNSCILFKAYDHPAIHRWIEKFVKATNYTGQIAFDFIETDKGLYTIECNPRATSGLFLFNEGVHIDQAFFKKGATPLFPVENSKQQVATGMLLYGWKKNAVENNSFKKYFKTLVTTKDVIIRASDIKPLLFQPIIFAALWKNSIRYRLPLPATYTYDHDWNGELLKR